MITTDEMIESMVKLAHGEDGLITQASYRAVLRQLVILAKAEERYKEFLGDTGCGFDVMLVH